MVVCGRCVVVVEFEVGSTRDDRRVGFVLRDERSESSDGSVRSGGAIVCSWSS